MLLVKLTNAMGKHDIYVDANIIIVVARCRDNPIETEVLTTLNTPKGPIVYRVLESASAVADAVNDARRGHVLPAVLQH